MGVGKSFTTRERFELRNVVAKKSFSLRKNAPSAVSSRYCILNKECILTCQMSLQLMRRIHRHLTDLTPDGATAHADVRDRRGASAYAKERAGIFELTKGLLRLDAPCVSRPFEVVFQNSHGREADLTRVTVDGG